MEKNQTELQSTLNEYYRTSLGPRLETLRATGKITQATYEAFRLRVTNAAREDGGAQDRVFAKHPVQGDPISPPEAPRTEPLR